MTMLGWMGKLFKLKINNRKVQSILYNFMLTAVLEK